ncbi:hypothetical protein [Streptosporangium carneum]|uniref:Septum formation initiator n=1 Tax=Streptosporangium carneum TaxID=47481 RepID=A0A9W6MFT2_9ACTN|nr:hypothetical protein [Streptosporangium carneum]GLK12984.1 hypothetical protein GCM10017600_63940 [Streptosporangium carneum]
MVTRGRLLLAVAGWLATASVATVAGVAVLSLLGGSLTGAAGHALTAQEVRAELAAASPRPPLPSSAASAGASPDASARTKVISVGGGTVVAACQDGQVRLRSWSPAQGHSVDDVEPGPGPEATVEFESDGSDLKVEIRCGSDGLPVHTVSS